VGGILPEFGSTFAAVRSASSMRAAGLENQGIGPKGRIERMMARAIRQIRG
jgi:hypothetical protein